MNSDKNRPITIEDLIRLKRAERPPVDFWARFDRELRAKQLAALVAKRPWWQTLPTASVRAFSRFRLPLGAAAVFGLAFLTVRDHRTHSSSPAIASVERGLVASSSTQGDSRGFASEDVTAAVADSNPSAFSGESSAPSIAAEEAVAANVILRSEDRPAVPLIVASASEAAEGPAATSQSKAVSLVST